ncbi:Glu/Leu/Phe/Val dehydrogenase dimerization domain-containing protein [Novosphingobium sp. P6W]|uniref:Leu/Phe/Val dehydrogenase n=1 Tax=Novosphingobium sp. P6W TaxID=1609758 RepID=UPI0005C2F249|nr:Glu/Leu/Phe/Val dehydrogenase dimerization domain-containing protein [Novosphingobium sp. P6W]AXB78817.1 Glu/Leu/Phe/Val dehydrogenase [Novosphingobium sp. P6W]KIS29913.1 amino acid dehydrogenase [Novosphingobium sp. P6W]
MRAKAQRMMPPMEYVRLEDEASGLDGVIAIHSTARGPAAGGCRFWTYSDPKAAAADAFRLAEGMSYKNAMAGLPFGGGKAVLRRPTGSFDRRALFEAFGRAIEKLDGRYITAEDVGTSVSDMENVAKATRYVAGKTAHYGMAGGDPSPWTALGVLEAMKAAVKTRYGSTLSGATVAILGVGNVGGRLADLLTEEGARLYIADIDPLSCARLSERTGAKTVPLHQITSVDAQVFAPCALGGAVTATVGANLRAGVICGAANNQLASADVPNMLNERGILYAPDYVVNAGGIINVAAEYLEESQEQVHGRVMSIGPRTQLILEEAKLRGVSPVDVADAMAEQKMRFPDMATA